MKTYCRLSGGLLLGYFIFLMLFTEWTEPGWIGLASFYLIPNFLMMAISVIVIICKKRKATTYEGIYFSALICSLPSLVLGLLDPYLFFHPFVFEAYELDCLWMYQVWNWYAWLALFSLIPYIIGKFISKKYNNNQRRKNYVN